MRRTMGMPVGLNRPFCLQRAATVNSRIVCIFAGAAGDEYEEDDKYEEIWGDAGYPYTRGEPEFQAQESVQEDQLLEDFVADIKTFHAAHLHTYVPRDCFDNEDLGFFSAKVRKAFKEDTLPEEWVRRLRQVNFTFSLHQLEAKWHHNYHTLRRFKHQSGGDVEIPANYTNPDEPKFVECSRWLQRQRVLYKKQSLHPYRVKMLRKLGVKLYRQHAPKRKNRNWRLLDPEKDRDALKRREDRIRLAKSLSTNGSSINMQRKQHVAAMREEKKQKKMKKYVSKIIAKYGDKRKQNRTAPK